MTDLAQSRREPSAWTDLGLISLVSTVLFLAFLGGYPLANPDESRYAQIGMEMVRTGDWVLPRLNDVFYFEKPPLVYWMNALVIEVFGTGELGLRAVPAFFAVLGICFTYLGGRGLAGRRAGLWAAVVAGSSLMYFIIGRILILDMPVSALITGTLVCFLRGVREERGMARRLWFMGLYACAALATLSKGLIGLAIPGAVMFLWLLVFNQWRRLLPMYLPTGAALYLAIAAPWHVLAAQRHPDWAWFYFVHEHWLRFTTTVHDRYAPWWYFIPILVAGFLPWTFHLWGGAREAVRGGWAARRERADYWFLLVWAGFIFLFFSKSQSKLAPYILPIFPALAILVGAHLDEALRNAQNRLRGLAWGFFGFALLLGLAALVVAVRPQVVGRDAAIVAQARPQLVLFSLALLGGGGGALWLTLKGRAEAGLRTQAVSWCAALVVVASASSLIMQRSSRDIAEVFAAKARPGDEVFHYKTFAHDFVWYSGHFVGLVDHKDELGYSVDERARNSGRFIDKAEMDRRWAGPRRVWVLARKGVAETLRDDPSGRYHLIASNRRYYLFSNQP